MHLVDVPGFAVVGEALELEFHLIERPRVEEFTELVLAEQVAEKVAVQRQRLGAPFSERRIAFVHVGGDVIEQQRAGERRSLRLSRPCGREFRGCGSTQHFDEAGQVEDIPQALAVGFEDDRERAVTARDGEQAGRALALQPQRTAGARSAPRQEQSAARRFRGSARRTAPYPPAARPAVLRSLLASGRASRTDGGSSPLGEADARCRRRSRWSAHRSRCVRRARASMAWAHGAWTRPPNGVRMHTRQSPSSSRKRSTTIVRSRGQGAGGLFFIGKVGEEVRGSARVEVVVGLEAWRAGASRRACRPVRA